MAKPFEYPTEGYDLNSTGLIQSILFFQLCFVTTESGVLSQGVFYPVCNFCKWIPTLTGGACYFKTKCLASSIPGQVHLGIVTNIVFRSTPCSGCFVLEPALLLGSYGS